MSSLHPKEKRDAAAAHDRSRRIKTARAIVNHDDAEREEEYGKVVVGANRDPVKRRNQFGRGREEVINQESRERGGKPLFLSYVYKYVAKVFPLAASLRRRRKIRRAGGNNVCPFSPRLERERERDRRAGGESISKTNRLRLSSISGGGGAPCRACITGKLAPVALYVNTRIRHARAYGARIYVCKFWP